MIHRQNKIKQKFDRVAKALSLKPSLGLGSGISTARITNGLACEIREDGWKFNTDMPSQAGGEDSGPTPGVLGRAALSSCLAIGYMMWASKLEVPIDSLEVEVKANWDDGGAFGTADVAPGYLNIIYCVKIQSSASKSQLIKVLDEGDRHSPYLDIFSNAQLCQRQVEINSDKEETK